MKVLLVTEGLVSGGAERQLVGLAVMLKNHGIDVSVLTYVNRNFYKKILDDAGVENEVYEPAFYKYLRPFRLSRKAANFHADIILSYLPGSNIALTLGKMFGLLKAKLIVSERNYTLKWGKRAKASYLLYRYADYLIVNSNAEKSNVLKNVNGLSNKIVTIENFVDSDFFHINNKSYGTSNHIACIARLRSYKNVIGFLECVKKLKERGNSFLINWYGYDYKDEFSDKVKSLVVNYNIGDVFHLNKPTDDILSVYKEVDAVCLPSFREGYPNTLIEAMSCGLPVLCSNVCENPYIVEDNKNGFLFDPYNIDSMVKTMEKFFNLSKDERSLMGEKNREKVIKVNSMESFFSKHMLLLDKLLK